MMTLNLTSPLPLPTHTYPDWCHVESLGVGAYDFNAFSPANAMALAKMFECSPVAHIAKVVVRRECIIISQKRRNEGGGES
jgi:hypothetical protein